MGIIEHPIKGQLRHQFRDDTLQDRGTVPQDAVHAVQPMDVVLGHSLSLPMTPCAEYVLYFPPPWALWLDVLVLRLAGWGRGVFQQGSMARTSLNLKLQSAT